jgi:hypothetical protein
MQLMNSIKDIFRKIYIWSTTYESDEAFMIRMEKEIEELERRKILEQHKNETQ